MKRPGITLVETLVAIFVMGIGLLALFVLFPLGALSMGQALKDDRTASAANNANHFAQAFDIRNDTTPQTSFTTPLGGSFVVAPGPPPITINLTLPATWPYESWPVFVDPYGSGALLSTVVGALGTTTPGLPRTGLSFVTSAAQRSRWCTFLDDITFTNAGVPDTVTGNVQRAGQYTWAYMLRRSRANVASVTDMSIVVFRGRSVQLLAGENAYTALGTAGSNSVTLSWTPGVQDTPVVRRGSWILDTTLAPSRTYAGTTARVVQGYWYRVVGVGDVVGGNTITLELQTPLKADLPAASGAGTVNVAGGVVVVMENVVEVIDKGTGRTP